MGFKKVTSDAIKLPGDVDLLMQTYENPELPEGVVVIKQNVFFDDQGGWFKENLRADKDGFVEGLKEQGIKFKILQSNTSSIAPYSRRFWHLHPEKKNHEGQNEIWSTDATLLVGLIDFRTKSKTYGAKTKIVLSNNKAVYIPAGVAHGLINPNNFPVTLSYFTDKVFTADSTTQEHRIDPEQLPFDFVEPEVI